MNKKTFLLTLFFLLSSLNLFFCSSQNKNLKTNHLPKKGSLKYYEAIGYLPEDKVEEYIEDKKYILENTYHKINDELVDCKTIDINIVENQLVCYGEKYLIFFKMNQEVENFNDLKKYLQVGISTPDFKKEILGLKPEELNISKKEKEVIQILNTIEHKGKKYEIDFSFHLFESLELGTSKIRIEDDTLYLNGELGTKTYVQIKNAIENSKIKKIVLEDVPGSFNDLINVHTGRLIRNNNITTVVKNNGFIASGGVDLFSSGIKRIAHQGAKIGVHSWCCKDDLTADELSEDDEAHHSQIEYFTEMMGEKNGRDFYFYTLKAAPFNSLHFMNKKEIEKYKLATEFVE